MAIRKLRLGALSSVCIMAFLPAQGFAQPALTDAKPQGVEEIIVTANKRDEALQNVPISITAFSQAQLDKRGATGLEGVQESTPNLNFATQSTGQNVARVTLRGIGTETLIGAGDPGVALHIDGVYVGRNSAAASDIFDLERLEVLRGPQGTLYGRNATGGSINFITRKPTDKLEGNADITLGNYSMFRARGVLNAPLSDTLSARISLSSDSHSGYIKNLYVSGRDNADKDTQAGRFQLRWQPKSGQDFLLRAYFQKFGGAGPGSKFLGADISTSNGYPALGNIGNSKGPVPAAGSRIQANVYGLAKTLTGQSILPRPTGYYEVRKDAAEFLDGLIKGLDFEGNVSLTDSIDLKTVSSYQTNHNEILVDGDVSELPIETRYRVNDARQFSQEFNLISNSDSALEWILGAYYYREKIAERFRTLVPAGLIPLSTPLPAGAAPGGGGVFQERFTQNTTNSYALFGQAKYNFTDRLSATVGLRQTWDKKDQSRTGGGQIDLTNGIRAPSSGAIGQEPPSGGKASWSEMTYRASLNFEATPSNLLFASFARGYKSGGFDFNGGRLTASGEQIPYNPEFVDAYEIGSKNQFFDRKLQLNLTAFHYKYRDLQVFKLTEAGPLTDNAAKSTIWGVEGEIKLQPSASLGFDGSFGYLDATYDEYSISIPPTSFAGNRLNFAPKWTASAGMDYIIPLRKNKLVTRLDWSYRSNTYFDRANTALDMQRAYSLINARLRYEADAYFVDLWAKNVTNAKYVTSQLISGTGPSAARMVNIGAPPTFGVTVGVHF